MNENGMPVKQSCLHCRQPDCTTKEQPNFDGLQVNTAENQKNHEHDEKLVDARMLNVISSTESRKTTTKSNDTRMRRHSDLGVISHSDYLLKRLMPSFAKLGTFMQRRHPRAKTHLDLEAHAHREALQRNNKVVPVLG